MSTGNGLTRSVRRHAPHALFAARGYQAFTLIEMLVVMAIIGLLISISVPSMVGYAKQARLKGATREVVGLLSLARSSAISSRAPKTVVVEPDERQLLLETGEGEEPSRVVKLSSIIDVAVKLQGEAEDAAGPWRLVFQPTGALAGRSASLTLSNGANTQTITVTSTTGAIFVQ